MKRPIGLLMSAPARRERGVDLAHRFNWMDRIFDEWMRSLPMRRPFGLALGLAR